MFIYSITLLISAISFSSVAVAAEPFLDTVDHPHQTEITVLQAKNLVEGYGSGLFRPNILINRAEFLKIVLLARYGGTALQSTDTNCFTDFVGTEWYYGYACQAKALGIIQGYPDGTFKGAQPINLAEALKIIVEAYGLPQSPVSVQNTIWYLPYFMIANEQNLFEYFPRTGEHLLTRSELAYALVHIDVPLLDPLVESRPLELESSSSSVSSVPPIDTEFYDFFNPVCGNGQIEIGEQCDDGNLANGDGCSELCLDTSAPVYQGFLTIAPSSFNFTGGPRGAKNVPVYAFTAKARRQAVELNGLSFAVNASNVLTDATVWVDTDNDFSADTQVGTARINGASITVSAMNATVPEDETVYFELRGEIARSTTASSVSVTIADQPDVIAQGKQTGEQLTGTQINSGACNDSTCFIHITITAPVAVPIVERGSLFITSTQTTKAKQIVASSESDALLELTFRAEQEPVLITEFSIESSYNGATFLLEDIADSTLSYRLTNTGCSSAATNVYCTTTDLEIPVNEERNFVLKADVSADTNGGKIGTITVQLPANPLIKITGVNSAQELVPNDANGVTAGEYFIGTSSASSPNTAIVSAAHQVVFAKIASIINAGSETDFLRSGKVQIANLQIRAVDNVNSSNGLNRVTLDSLTFTVVAQNSQVFPDGFTLYNIANSAVKIDCTGDKNTGTITVVCSNSSNKDGFSIESGKSEYFALEAVILNTKLNSAEDSYLVTSIATLGTNASAGDVLWSDGEQSLHWVELNDRSVTFTTFE